MIISKVDNKIYIHLTHTEVIVIFGEYNKISVNDIKHCKAFRYLINSTLMEYRKLFKDGDIQITLKAKKELGCKIIIAPIEIKRKNEYVFYFSSVNILTMAVLYLYKNRIDYYAETDLYKFDNKYILLIRTDKINIDLSYLYEFGHEELNNEFASEYIKEYGIPLIEKDAVFKYALYFL